MTSKLKIQYVAGIFFSLFLCSIVNAQTYRLNGSYYLRNDQISEFDKVTKPNFRTLFSTEETKILDFKHGGKVILPKNTDIKVLKTVELRNGAEGLQIEILSKGFEHVKSKGKFWIYKGNDDDFTDIDVDTPTVATQAQVQATGIKCEGNCKSTPSHIPEVVKKNSADLAKFSRKLMGDQNKPPEPSKIKEPWVASQQPAVAFDEQIKNYSESSEVEAALGWAYRNRNSRSTGKCHRKVKLALATKDKNGSSLIPKWYSGTPAREAKDKLKEYGFQNLLEVEPYKSQITAPSQAPKGAVLVYSSNINCPGTSIPNCGHVEMKMGNGNEPGYISDYRSATAINETPHALRQGSRYKLIGVMVKPMEKK